MKKILPSALLVALFGLLLVVQMLVHGQKITATKIEGKESKYSLYESALTKIKAQNVKGETIDFSQIESPLVVLNFWASWCKPCLKELPSLKKLQEKFSSQISIVGVNSDESEQEKHIAKIKEKYALNFDSVLDKDGSIASTFNVTRIPASIVYFKGKIIHYSEEEFDFMNEDFIELLESKLQ
tara:strand:+ start:17083 stop:17631 length:549 start_codon:yes stop_codon:yes gene_type:complete